MGANPWKGAVTEELSIKVERSSHNLHILSVSTQTPFSTAVSVNGIVSKGVKLEVD